MTEEQLLAINKKYGNILVSASAGSGKTTVLIERIISKCINEKIDIDRLLVVTFTNAAAAELKERLLLAIYKELDKDPSNKFLKRQLINLNRASITTIHSFCLDVITSNFYLLDLDPNVSICDESLSNILKNKAIENILDKEYEKNNSDVKQKTDELYKVMKMFSGNDDKFIDTILNIYSYINSFAYPFLWLKEQIEKYNIKDIDVDLCEYDFGKQIYDDCINNLMIIHVKLLEFHEKFLKIDNSSKFLDVINQDMEMIDRCIKCSYNSWDKLYSNLNDISFLSMPRTKIEAEDLKLELQNFRNTYMKNSVKKLKESVYENSKNISTELLSCYNYLTFLYNFLFDFNNEYSNLKKLANVIDFNDIEHMALSVLTKRIDKEDGTYEYVPSDIAKKIQEKFVQVYIDEYQDTSFVQEAILSAVSGMKNRFMVGDIKQSIYKFRQAMPQIFNEKYEKYSLLKNINESEMLSEEQDKCYKILLSKNFRSRKSVIDSINYIFEKIMSKRLGECDYSNLEKLQFGASYYTENDSTDYITEINIVDKKEEDNSTYDNEEESQEYANYIKDLKRFEIEAEYIAKRIYEYINKEKNKVTNKDGSLRNVTYKDIVLLLRSIKNKGQILEAALKKYNIPAFADTNTNLFDSDEILLVMSMLSVIDNPYQDIPLVSVMYSIIGNFTLDDLCDISKYKEDYLYNVLINVKNGVYDKDKEEYYLKEKVNKFLNILEYFRKYKEVYSISELLIHLYKKTNIYYQFYAKKNMDEIKANLDHLSDLAVKFENSNINTSSTIYSFISYVEKISKKADSDSSTAKIIGENENVVRIMTIHKSKGLEFPVVFLCDTNTKYNFSDLIKPIVMHHSMGIGINYINDKFNITYPSIIKQGIKSLITKEIKSEELRMLYVALTRAKEKLIIFATISNYSKYINDMFVMYDNNRIDPIAIEQNDTYIKNIIMALKSDIIQGLNDNKLFKINVFNVYDNENKIINIDNEACVKDISLIEKLNSISKIKDAKYIDNKLALKIKKNIIDEYPYIIDTKTESRISVSKLKKQENEQNIKEIYADDKPNINSHSKTNMNEMNMIKPKCLSENTSQDYSLRKGVLVHFILETLDFNEDWNKQKLIDYIDSLHITGVISKEDKEKINIEDLCKFLNSKIYKDVTKLPQNMIRKEEQFILKSENISRSFIQGVIDLYYIKDSKITLVDFKTDRLKNEEDYILRYKKQLVIYKEALEKLTGYLVDNVYIYSFTLGKEIKLDI